MKKRAAVKEQKQEQNPVAMSVAMQQLMLPLLLAMDATKKGLLSFVQQMGMVVLSELLVTEATQIAGPKGQHMGEKLYRRWHFWATHSSLAPVKKVAETIRDHLPGVMAYFTHRITNSASEALNSTIQMLKKRSFGFRSFENFRVAVLFRCGGLQLHP